MTLLDEAVVLNDGNLMPKVGTITADEPSINQAIKSGVLSSWSKNYLAKDQSAGLYAN